jgi:hypothetical protein
MLTSLIAAGALVLAAVLFLQPKNRASAFVFSSPINGGCYIAAPNQCKIHIDPFNVNLAPGSQFVEFQLQAAGQTIYHFKTDVSNPPVAPSYSPSMVMQDFAATCGKTYTINILGRDTSNANLLNMGQIEGVICPSSVP